jgi:metal-responsive CopG/Arc/MetJ family transcriptional regulator
LGAGSLLVHPEAGEAVKSISIRIPDELADRIGRLADINLQSRNSQIIDLLTTVIAKKEKTR